MGECNFLFPSIGKQVEISCVVIAFVYPLMPWLLSPIHFLLKPNSWRSALRFILRPYLLGRNSSSLFCLSQKFGEKLVEFRCQMSESWVAQNFQIPFDLQLFTGLAIPREWSGDHHSGFQYLWLYDLKAKGRRTIPWWLGIQQNRAMIGNPSR